jgi:hypothetical protein
VQRRRRIPRAVVRSTGGASAEAPEDAARRGKVSRNSPNMKPIRPPGLTGSQATDEARGCFEAVWRSFELSSWQELRVNGTGSGETMPLKQWLIFLT